MKIINGIGVADANGNTFLSYEDRMALYKECGFTSVMLWWGDDDTSREERVRLARENNLHIADVHSDYRGMNSIWLEGEEGCSKHRELLEEIEDCHRYGINTIVMHLTNGDNPPGLTELGLKRLGEVFDLASEYDIDIALENTRESKVLRYVLDANPNSNIKLCYDSGHENLWTKEVDWLALYGDRVGAIHLHNNFGERDEHNKLSQGEIQLDELRNRLMKTDYQGSLNTESVYSGEGDVHKLREYLKEILDEGRRFLELTKM